MHYKFKENSHWNQTVDAKPLRWSSFPSGWRRDWLLGRTSSYLYWEINKLQANIHRNTRRRRYSLKTSKEMLQNFVNNICSLNELRMSFSEAQYYERLRMSMHLKNIGNPTLRSYNKKHSKTFKNLESVWGKSEEWGLRSIISVSNYGKPREYLQYDQGYISNDLFRRQRNSKVHWTEPWLRRETVNRTPEWCISWL